MTPFVTAFIGVAVLTPVVRLLARRCGVVARPSDHGWHRRPVPLLGGIAIYAGLALSLLTSGARGADVLIVAVCATAMFVLGLVDDFVALKPSTKLVGQLVIACGFTIAAGPTGWLGNPAADALVTITWFVGITNAFNLLDNMDGLCAGIAAIAGLAFALAGGTGDLVGLAGALTGAAAGFLLYNFHPARIFMGDSGSLLLGATLAMLTLRVEHRHTAGVISTLAFPVLLMLVPLFDTTFVTVSRKLSARAASMGGKDHTSHRLVTLGFPEPKAVLLLYSFAAAAGLTAVLLTRAPIEHALLLTGVLVVAIVLLGVRLARVNVYGDADFILLRGGSLTPLLFEVTYKRRVFELLLDFVLVSIAYYASYVLRFDSEFPKYYGLLVRSLPIVIACKLAGLYAAGVYLGTWRYISLVDVWTFGKGVAYGTLSCVLALVYLYRFQGYSRGVFVIDMLLFGVLVIGSRVAFRALGDLAQRHRPGGRRLAIYGAGDSGSMLVRELRSNATLDYRPVMFIDDNAAAHGKRILGVPVAGGESVLTEALATAAVEVVAVTAPLSHDRLRQLLDLCRSAGAELLRWHAVLEPVYEADDDAAVPVERSSRAR
jgi:UDP-GlcNAc:undecaprenyl-phosphate/decaprenyl-phosphate GlcNAc-1-phosphate transferase